MGSNSEHAYSSHAHAVNTIKEAGEHIRPIDTKVRYERRAIVAQFGRCNVIPGMVPNVSVRRTHLDRSRGRGCQPTAAVVDVASKFQGISASRLAGVADGSFSNTLVR